MILLYTSTVVVDLSLHKLFAELLGTRIFVALKVLILKYFHSPLEQKKNYKQKFFKTSTWNHPSHAICI